MSSKSSTLERRFCYSSNRFWEKLIFQLFQRLAKAAMKSERVRSLLSLPEAGCFARCPGVVSPVPRVDSPED